MVIFASVLTNSGCNCAVVGKKDGSIQVGEKHAENNQEQEEQRNKHLCAKGMPETKLDQGPSLHGDDGKGGEHAGT